MGANAAHLARPAHYSNDELVVIWRFLGEIADAGEPR
jgi:hypothetical protein